MSNFVALVVEDDAFQREVGFTPVTGHRPPD
jgi:hypothetical protein